MFAGFLSPRSSTTERASLHPEKYCKGEVMTWQDGLRGIPLRIIVVIRT